MRIDCFRAGLVLAAALGLAACQSNMMSDSLGGISAGQLIGGTTKQVRDVQPVGGFLPNPSLLQPGGQGDAALLYRNASVNLTRYNAVMLDPVVVYSGPSSTFSRVAPGDRQGLANSFTQDMANALKNDCRVTARPGPGVIRLRFALVDATEPNPVLNTAATYVPYVSTAVGAAAYAYNNNVSFFAGSATIEGYATDAANGTLLWQAVDKRAGQQALLSNTLNTKTDIDHAFQAWSALLVKRLTAIGLCGS